MQTVCLVWQKAKSGTASFFCYSFHYTTIVRKKWNSDIYTVTDTDTHKHSFSNISNVCIIVAFKLKIYCGCACILNVCKFIIRVFLRIFCLKIGSVHSNITNGGADFIHEGQDALFFVEQSLDKTSSQRKRR